MSEMFIPVLSHFENGNPWSASIGRLRWRVQPVAGEKSDTGTLQAEVWEGPWAYEFSTVEETCSFPLSEKGLRELPVWLEHWREIIEARPARTFSENIQRREAARKDA